MELEFFCKPGTDMEWFEYWRSFCINWLKDLGIKDDEMRARDHSPEELCFYSKGTTDIEYLFPFGWGELWGIADRTDYDLTQHQNTSGQDLTYFDDRCAYARCINPVATMADGDSIYAASIGDVSVDRKSTRLNSSHRSLSRMPSSA